MARTISIETVILGDDGHWRPGTLTVPAKGRGSARPDTPADGIVGPADELRLDHAIRDRELRMLFRTPAPTFTDAEPSGPSIGRPADVPAEERADAALAMAEARERLATAARSCAMMTDAERLARASRTARTLVAIHRPVGMTAPVMIDLAEEATADGLADWHEAAARVLGGSLGRLSALADVADDRLPPSVGYYVTAHVRRLLRHGRPQSIEAMRESEDDHPEDPAMPEVPATGGPELSGPDDSVMIVRNSAGAVIGAVMPNGAVIGSADGTAEAVRVSELCGADFASETGRAVLASAHDAARSRKTARGTARKAVDRKGRPAKGRGRPDNGERAAYARELLAVPMTEHERAVKFAARFRVSEAAWRVYKSRMLRG